MEIEPVGPEPLETALARRDGPPARRIGGIDLADEERIVAAPGHGHADEPLGRAVGVARRGVDQAHPEVEPEPERRDLLLDGVPPLGQATRAQPQDRDRVAGGQRDLRDHHRRN